MKYPINEEEFVNAWLHDIGHYDDVDRVFVEALVKTLNDAYAAGLRDGLKAKEHRTT